jgi:RNA recognition motif-containing protein
MCPVSSLRFMFPDASELEDVRTESDVEHKVLWPLLTFAYPSGFALAAPDVVTKLSIRRLEIGKGTSRKLFYPDYIVVMAGLPVLVIEAKSPTEDVGQGLNEARLYGNELNSLFPESINPCFRVISCNGVELLSCPIDTAEPDVRLGYADLVPAHLGFARLVERCGRSALQERADTLRSRLRKSNYQRPLAEIGGPSFQDEELPQNTFGATIAGDYGHIFNPKTREDRANIVRHAYVSSSRRQRYIEPIDRLIRSAVTPPAAGIPMLEDTGQPKEIAAALRDRKNLENQVLLLVGSVGAGKSTFVDYVSVVGLPKDLRERTLWLRVNLNEAPLSPALAYGWVAQSLVAEMRLQSPATDFDHIDTLQKVFAPELNTLKKGALAVLEPTSVDYRTRLADRLMALQADNLSMAKAMARYLCGGPGRLLVIVLDNCDKRNRDEQLTMFQVAQWVQNEFRSLVVLPIRDVTFELHRNEPPLDTVLKQLVFRIEPPLFAEVLQARVRLALEAMRAASDSANTFSYLLPNGMRVTYPAADQGLYLASMLRSLYAHDRFVRQVISGVAGRDVRRALEMFLDFCTSGHIGEDEIYKIRFFEGRYVLPPSIVSRVLLRSQRRYYDGNKSYLKNLVQCFPDDALPDHFVRLSILHWLDKHQRAKGPAGAIGFHRATALIVDLVQLGHDAARVRSELLYLLRERCIVAEHLRAELLTDQDLIRITASGVVHLQMMANADYLAACAEDTSMSDTTLVHRVVERMTTPRSQLSRTTTARTANEFVAYLKERASERLAKPGIYLADNMMTELNTLGEAEAAIAAEEIEVSSRLFVGGIPFDAVEDDVRRVFTEARLAVRDIGMPRDSESPNNRGYAFVEMVDGRTAMAALDAVGSLIMNGRPLRIAEAYGEAQTARRHGVAKLSERLFVGSLSFAMDETGVRQLFRAHDLEPADITVVRDKNSGQSRGFAFVTLTSVEEAARAIGALHDTLVGGRRIVVRPANPRGESGRRVSGESRNRSATQ